MQHDQPFNSQATFPHLINIALVSTPQCPCGALRCRHLVAQLPTDASALHMIVALVQSTHINVGNAVTFWKLPAATAASPTPEPTAASAGSHDTPETQAAGATEGQAGQPGDKDGHMRTRPVGQIQSPDGSNDHTLALPDRDMWVTANEWATQRNLPALHGQDAEQAEITRYHAMTAIADYLDRQMAKIQLEIGAGKRQPETLLVAGERADEYIGVLESIISAGWWLKLRGMTIEQVMDEVREAVTLAAIRNGQ